MIDNVNHTSDFQVDDSQRSTSSADQWKNNVSAKVNQFRDYARANPSKVLGGLAALAIGAGLMRGRRT